MPFMSSGHLGSWLAPAPLCFPLPFVYLRGATERLTSHTVPGLRADGGDSSRSLTFIREGLRALGGEDERVSASQVWPISSRRGT